ncbi:MAG: right-handed parallel beta-helix repeat-containing protein [Bacteroidota bacterium]
MLRILFFSSLILSLSFSFTAAQNVYVDALHGEDSNVGSKEAPFQSLARAVHFANTQTGTGNLSIKLNPGLYLLEGRIDINPVRVLHDTARYIIEASVMPDDEGWSPEKMPVIQSISTNNSTTQFPHATGLLVAASHVSIRGLKFLGNAQPEVNYYYPISKEDMSLEDLEVSQCVFVGDKEAAKIQGGVWAHGPKNTISHCVFYGCRNGVLFFNNVRAFTIEHSIIYGAYESAFWFGPEDDDFTFTNNIISHNACFLVGPQDMQYSSPFSNSIISDNQTFVGYWSRDEQAVKSLATPNIKMVGVQRRAKIELTENLDVMLAPKHLHLRQNSDGQVLKAGIFKKTP